MRSVEARTTLVQFDAPGASTNQDITRLAINLEAAPSGWVGELRIEGPERRARRVEGTECSEVVNALALITVLRLESHLATSSPPRNSSSPGSPVAPIESTNASDTRAISDASANELATEITTQADPGRLALRAVAEIPAPTADAGNAALRDTADEERSNQPESPAVIATALFGQVGYASTPDHAFKAALGAEVSFGSGEASWRTTLGAGYAGGSTTSDTGTSTLTLVTAQVALCSPAILEGGWWWLRPCLELRAGAIAISLSPRDRALETSRATRPWLGLGPRLDLGVPLSPAWQLRGSTGATFHLVRDDFVLERVDVSSNTIAQLTLYEPDLLSLELTVGLAYTF